MEGLESCSNEKLWFAFSYSNRICEEETSFNATRRIMAQRKIFNLHKFHSNDQLQMEYSVLFFSLLPYYNLHTRALACFKQTRRMNESNYKFSFFYWGFQNPLNDVSRVALLKVEDQWNIFTNFVRISFDFSFFRHMLSSHQRSSTWRIKQITRHVQFVPLYVSIVAIPSVMWKCHTCQISIVQHLLSTFFPAPRWLWHILRYFTSTLDIFCTHWASEKKHPNPISSGNFISAMIDRWNNFPSKIHKNCMQQKSPQRH